MKLFFSVQLGHLKLSGYGLLSTQGVQNRSQNCRSISQSEVILQYMRDPGPPAVRRPKGVLTFNNYHHHLFYTDHILLEKRLPETQHHRIHIDSIVAQPQRDNNIYKISEDRAYSAIHLPGCSTKTRNAK